MDHNLTVTDLRSFCTVCGARVTLAAVLAGKIGGCPGVAVPGTNIVYFGMQKAGAPRKNVIIEDLAGKCECGAHKLGHPRGSFHSSWCPWSK